MLFGNPFPKCLIFKNNFLHAMAVLRYLPKVKKGSRTSFLSTFSAWFFHKNVFYLILYQWPNFHCHTFFLSQYMKHVLLSSYLDSWWRHKLYDLSWTNLLSNGWQGEKEGNTEIQKFEYLEDKKSFLDEMKKKFHSFWRAIIWLKVKIW